MINVHKYISKQQKTLPKLYFLVIKFRHDIILVMDHYKFNLDMMLF